MDRDFRRGGGRTHTLSQCPKPHANCEGGSRPNHPFSQTEAVGYDPALGIAGGITAIGKGSCGVVEDDPSVFGEFIGLMKVSARGRAILLDAIQDLGIEVLPDGQVKHHKFGVELLGRPLAEAYICDLLQHLIAQGALPTPEHMCSRFGLPGFHLCWPAGNLTSQH